MKNRLHLFCRNRYLPACRKGLNLCLGPTEPGVVGPAPFRRGSPPQLPQDQVALRPVQRNPRNDASALCPIRSRRAAKELSNPRMGLSGRRPCDVPPTVPPQLRHGHQPAVLRSRTNSPSHRHHSQARKCRQQRRRVQKYPEGSGEFGDQRGVRTKAVGFENNAESDERVLVYSEVDGRGAFLGGAREAAERVPAHQPEADISVYRGSAFVDNSDGAAGVRSTST